MCLGGVGAAAAWLIGLHYLFAEAIWRIIVLVQVANCGLCRIHPRFFHYRDKLYNKSSLKVSPACLYVGNCLTYNVIQLGTGIPFQQYHIFNDSCYLHSYDSFNREFKHALIVIEGDSYF